ncbi:MAG: aminoglycoside phosphotransferase family protein [Solirubrobacteraceae bacterium]
MATTPKLDLDGLAVLGVDDALIAKRERLDGHRALRFLAELPALAACWEARLGLHGARIMPGGVLSAALACRRRSDGAPVVLKLSARHATSPGAEAAALAAWDGVGACPLLYTAEDGRVLLLGAICPGVPVRPSDDDREDTRLAGKLLSALHRIPAERIPAGIPDAAQELRWRFERAHQQLDGPSHATGMVSHRDLDAAHKTALALHAQSRGKVMCHGDFMNKNILLDAPGNWWAIDPRPCIADRCLDAAFWSLTHRPGERVKQRCELVARTARLDADRVWAWALVFAVSEAVLVTDLPRAHAHHSVLGG